MGKRGDPGREGMGKRERTWTQLRREPGDRLHTSTSGEVLTSTVATGEFEASLCVLLFGDYSCGHGSSLSLYPKFDAFSCLVLDSTCILERSQCLANIRDPER